MFVRLKDVASKGSRILITGTTTQVRLKLSLLRTAKVSYFLFKNKLTKLRKYLYTFTVTNVKVSL